MLDIQKYYDKSQSKLLIVRSGYDWNYYVNVICSVHPCTAEDTLLIRSDLRIFGVGLEFPELDVVIFSNIKTYDKYLTSIYIVTSRYIVLLREEVASGSYIAHVDRYCFYHSLNNNCPALFDHFHNVIANTANVFAQSEICLLLQIPEVRACEMYARSIIRKWRVPPYSPSYEEQRLLLHRYGVAHDAGWEWGVLQRVHVLLTDSQCTHITPTANPAPGHCPGLTVPCDSYPWVEGHWVSLGAGAVLRCPVGGNIPSLCMSPEAGSSPTPPSSQACRVFWITETLDAYRAHWEGSAEEEGQGQRCVHHVLYSGRTGVAGDNLSHAGVHLHPVRWIDQEESPGDQATPSLGTMLGVLLWEHGTGHQLRLLSHPWAVLDHLLGLHSHSHSRPVLQLVGHIRAVLPVLTATLQDMRYMTSFMGSYIESRQFRLLYRRPVSGPAAVGNVSLHPLLRHLGFDFSLRGVEVVLQAAGHVPGWTNTGNSDPTLPAAISRTPSGGDNWFSGSARSLDSYADRHAYISEAGLTAAVLQVLPTIHTEVIGPAVRLLLDAGYSRVIVYYDRRAGDAVHLLDLFEGSGEWDVRHPGRCFQESREWDHLLLVTGDEAYFRGIQAQVTLHADRILAIQHSAGWLAPRIIPKSLLLTPIHGRHLSLFPFIHPSRSWDSSSVTPRMEGLSEWCRRRLTLLVLGSVGEAPGPGETYTKYKDTRDILAFLSQSVQHTVINVAKEVADYVSVMQEYPDRALFFHNVSYTDLRFILETPTLRYVWIPVRRDSYYALGTSFASSLAFAFGFRKVLVLPRFMAALYGLEHVAITYNQSVVEVQFNPAREQARLRGMQQWEDRMRVNNVMNMHACMESNVFCA